MKLFSSFLGAAALLAFAQPAVAQAEEPAASPNAFAKIGFGRQKLADKGVVAVNGVVDPGADYTTPVRWLGSLEVGAFVTGGLALQVGATTPTTTSNTPAGSLEGVPNLFDDTFSVFTATATYHPFRGGTVSPYVGGGIAYQHVWSTEEELATNVEVGDAHGPVIQAGAEFNITPRFGAFIDAKKAFYKNDAAGDLGPARVTARAELDPFIIQVGGLIRF
jgi:outer membrane protein